MTEYGTYNAVVRGTSLRIPGSVHLRIRPEPGQDPGRNQAGSTIPI